MRIILVILSSLFLSANVWSQCNPTVSISASPVGEICKGQTLTLTGSATDAGNTPTYIWIAGNDTVYSNTFSSTFNQNQTVYLAVISSPPCTTIDTVITTYSVQVTTIEAQYDEPSANCFSKEATVEITGTSGGVFSYTYELDSVDQGDNTTFSNLSIGSHMLVITDGNGCRDTNYIDIPEPLCENPVPLQAFTPNNDGYTDTWVILLIEQYPDNKVYIYDRWGQRVYYKEGYTNADGWDATFGGVPLPVSTYYYVIMLGVDDENGKERYIKGPVSIFR